MEETILFYVFGALLLVSALRVVTVRNVFHSALYLALALFAGAALYALLNAYFLAAMQVLLYIGAVVVLAVFVINLTRDITGRVMRLERRWVIPAALVSALTACLIIIALLKTRLPQAAPEARPPAADATALLGRYLLGDFVLPFEIVSVLLLSALIAAIAIVGREPKEGQ